MKSANEKEDIFGNDFVSTLNQFILPILYTDLYRQYILVDYAFLLSWTDKTLKVDSCLCQCVKKNLFVVHIR